MNSLFNSGPESSADEPLRPAAAEPQVNADDDGEPMLFASASRRAASPSFSSSAAASSPADKEITLSTMTVLGIFFLLAVMCAGFFAFGYSTGSKHSGKPGTGAAITDASLPGCKPAPGSLIGTAAPAAMVTPMNVPYTQPAVPAARPSSATVASSAPMAETVAVPVAQEPAVVVPERAAARTPPATVPVTAPPAAPAAQQATMVQVAALSHQADAEMVASALKGRGYSVSIHSSASDPLMHVQLGPFATRKDAEAMRQKLLGDGFNAILK